MVTNISTMEIHTFNKWCIFSTADKCTFSVQLRKNGKGLKIGTKEADTT